MKISIHVGEIFQFHEHHLIHIKSHILEELTKTYFGQVNYWLFRQFDREFCSLDLRWYPFDLFELARPVVQVLGYVLVAHWSLRRDCRCSFGRSFHRRDADRRYNLGFTVVALIDQLTDPRSKKRKENCFYC